MTDQQVIKQISLDLIDDPVHAMRSEVDDEEIAELATSIAKHGLIQPITVRPVGNRYEVIAGHRRTKAARAAGLASIPAVIRNADDETALILKMHENLLRRDVDVVDEACFIGEYLSQHKMSIADFAALINRSEKYVRDRLEVFNMPDYLQFYLKHKMIPLGVALELNQITDEKDKKYYSAYAAQNGAAVATVKRWRIDLNSRKPITDSERVQVIENNQTVEYERKKVRCARCLQAVYLDEAESVWIHRDCPPEPTPGGVDQ